MGLIIITHFSSQILPGSIKVKMEIVEDENGRTLEETIQLLKAEVMTNIPTPL